MDRERILAFRLSRSGLARRDASKLSQAAATPASDFAGDAAIQALAARLPGLTREAYDDAVEDAREIVLAHVVRGAIHALPADDWAIFGRSLIATDEDDLGRQLGEQVRRLAKAKGFAPTDALAEVAEATAAALGRGKALSKDELHQALRDRVGDDLLPWCKSCGSHHVAPMLWRYAGVSAGARLDSQRHYVLGKPGRAKAAEAARRFLRAYAPATAGDFAEWAGVAKSHGERLWSDLDGELIEVSAGRRSAWALAEDEGDLDSPPDAEGVVMLPPGDPFLQRTNRPLLVPDEDLRKRLFRPVASPGAVLKDGRLVGIWKARAKGRNAEVTVDRLGRVAKRDLEEEATRIATLRGADEAMLVLA